jgi:hypothetical protein
MSRLPKWTEERADFLVNYVGDESPVSLETVAGASDELETTSRAVASKLRKMGFDVEKVSGRAHSKYTPEQEATLREFVTSNEGEYTYAEIAKAFEDGAFTPKSIQGKILSMELTDYVKPAPKPETVRTFSPEEEATFIEMATNGAFMEEIAEALDRDIKQVRGKALSLLKNAEIPAIPRQEHTKGSNRADPLEGVDVANMNVEEIADLIDKTPRGVRVMLTRRGLDALDWNGAERAEKNRANAAG